MLSGYDKVSNPKHRSTLRPYSLDMFNEMETTGAPGMFKAFPCRICQQCIKLAFAGCHCCCSSMKFNAGQPCWFCGWQALSSMLLHEHSWLLPWLPGVYKNLCYCNCRTNMSWVHLVVESEANSVNSTENKPLRMQNTILPQLLYKTIERSTDNF